MSLHADGRQCCSTRSALRGTRLNRRPPPYGSCIAPLHARRFTARPLASHAGATGGSFSVRVLLPCVGGGGAGAARPCTVRVALASAATCSGQPRACVLPSSPPFLPPLHVEVWSSCTRRRFTLSAGNAAQHARRCAAPGSTEGPPCQRTCWGGQGDTTQAPAALPATGLSQQARGSSRTRRDRFGWFSGPAEEEGSKMVGQGCW